MNECPNVSIRDLLPLHVNGRLAAAERDVVASHLESCAPCRDEVQLLRTARQALHRTPVVDASRIARALPPYQVGTREGDPAVVPLTSRVRIAPAWRVAAAAMLVVGGGAALAIHQARTDDGPAVVAAGDTTARDPGSLESTPDAVSVAASPMVSATPSGSRDAAPQLTFGGGLDGLSDEDLVALIAAFDDEDMIPSAEPDRVFGLPASLADEEDS